MLMVPMRPGLQGACSFIGCGPGAVYAPVLGAFGPLDMWIGVAGCLSSELSV